MCVTKRSCQALDRVVAAMNAWARGEVLGRADFEWVEAGTASVEQVALRGAGACYLTAQLLGGDREQLDRSRGVAISVA